MLDPQAGPHTKISEMDLYTALKIAASKGNLPIVKLLISRGAPVNYPDEPGSTTPLRAAVLSRSLEVVNLLIAKGAKMNDTNDENETLLLKATNSGLWDIAEKILRKGMLFRGLMLILPLNIFSRLWFIANRSTLLWILNYMVRILLTRTDGIYWINVAFYSII